jgi:hypothetical protein
MMNRFQNLLSISTCASTPRGFWGIDCAITRGENGMAFHSTTYRLNLSRFCH